MVDNQDMSSIIIFLAQIIDLYSDIIFAVHLNHYHQFAQNEERDLIDKQTENKLFMLYILSLLFVVIPLILNFYSAMTTIHSLSSDESLSSFSRQYLKDRARLYSVLVMISGGSFRALKFMSSNFCGLPSFSSGLSTLQMERFRRHHVWSVCVCHDGVVK